MKNFRFNYIITIHNKEELIGKVLEGVLACCKENSYIYPVFDRPTDDTEKIIDEIIQKNPQVPITKVLTPDVHELRKINAGLRAASQNEPGCNIIVQDDVIIKDYDLENLVFKIYNHFGYSNIGYLGFRHGVNIYLKDRPEICEYFRSRKPVIEERNIIESAYGTGMSPIPLSPHEMIERMVAIGSPQCLSCEVVNKIGIMDEQLAPVGWSCHDISLRCLEAGLRNYVFALKFQSEVEWGTMHNKTTGTPGLEAIYARNVHYLYKKHEIFLGQFRESKEYYRLKLSRPFLVPGITISPEEKQSAIKKYYTNRKRHLAFGVHFISKYIKLPLKWILIRLRLY
ncbi:MAG: glycosyltransferase [Patescibacteria group bacterium]|nr:glycosyltransferase [Patescibacteria group bacterium]